MTQAIPTALIEVLADVMELGEALPVELGALLQAAQGEASRLFIGNRSWTWSGKMQVIQSVVASSWSVSGVWPGDHNLSGSDSWAQSELQSYSRARK